MKFSLTVKLVLNLRCLWQFFCSLEMPCYLQLDSDMCGVFNFQPLLLWAMLSCILVNVMKMRDDNLVVMCYNVLSVKSVTSIFDF